MPYKIKRPCNKPGCPELTHDRYCPEHAKERLYDNRRGSAADRGYDARWRKYREIYLKLHPLCACDDCKKKGLPLPADVVDHIRPHRGSKKLFWDPKNHQAMNSRCHSRKTAREDGGFGNKV